MNQVTTKNKPRSVEDSVRNIKMILSSPKWCLETVKHILGINSSFINEPQFQGRTLLQVMICDDRGTEDMVNFLIDHNADLNLDLYRGYLLLEALAFCKKRQGIVKILIERGVNVPNRINSESALSRAIAFGYGKDILKMITNQGADPNHIDWNSKSVLCVALSSQPKLEVFEFLLEAGATVMSCQLHCSPLHCIVCGPPIRSDIVRLMVKHGARGNVVFDNFYKKTVIHIALMNCLYETGAMKILIDSDESIDVKVRDDRDSTMLHDALCNTNCKVGMVKLLIDLGVSVGSIDWQGDTPLHKAVRHHPGDPKFIRVLLKLKSPVNVANRAGETALHIAYKMQQGLEIIRLLMGFGESIFRHPLPLYQRTRRQTSEELAHTVRQILMTMSLIHHQETSMLVAKRVCQPESLILVFTQRFQELSVSGSQREYKLLMPVTQTVQQLLTLLTQGLCHLDSPIMSDALKYFAFERNNENVNILQTMLKYSLLENPMTDVYNFINRYSNSFGDSFVWIRYWVECLREIEQMARKKMYGNLELINVVGYGSGEPHRNSYGDTSVENNNILLTAVANGEFSYYSEILSAKITREFLQEVFPGIRMFTIKYSEHRNYEITLNSNCLENLGNFLSRTDLLKMILLFHKDYKQL